MAMIPMWEIYYSTAFYASNRWIDAYHVWFSFLAVAASYLISMAFVRVDFDVFNPIRNVFLVYLFIPCPRGSLDIRPMSSYHLAMCLSS